MLFCYRRPVRTNSGHSLHESVLLRAAWAPVSVLRQGPTARRAVSRILLRLCPRAHRPFSICTASRCNALAACASSPCHSGWPR